MNLDEFILRYESYFGKWPFDPKINPFANEEAAELVAVRTPSEVLSALKHLASLGKKKPLLSDLTAAFGVKLVDNVAEAKANELNMRIKEQMPTTKEFCKVHGTEMRWCYEVLHDGKIVFTARCMFCDYIAEHGKLSEFMTGWLNRSTVEPFHYEEPIVQKSADLDDDIPF
jgi:hypothetical protein